MIPRIAKAYGYNLFVALSQLLNAILAGDPDETICGRSGKAAAKGKWWAAHIAVPLLDGLNGPGHCARSMELDEGRNIAAKRREFD